MTTPEMDRIASGHLSTSDAVNRNVNCILAIGFNGAQTFRVESARSVKELLAVYDNVREAPGLYLCMFVLARVIYLMVFYVR